MNANVISPIMSKVYVYVSFTVIGCLFVWKLAVKVPESEQEASTDAAFITLVLQNVTQNSILVLLAGNGSTN